MRLCHSLSKTLVFVNSVALLLVGSFLFNLSSAQANVARSEGGRILQSDAKGIVLELQVPAYTFRIVEVDGHSYQRLSVEGYGLSSAPGEPELPQRGLLLGIPSHAEASLKVLGVETTIAGGFDVYPVPQRSIEPLDPGRVALDQTPKFQVRFVRNQSIYTTNAFFPSTVAEIGDSGYLRDQRYVQVLIHPVQYNPVTGELRHHQYIKLQISFSYPQGRLSLTPGRAESPAFETLLRNSILNYETAKAWRSGPQPKVQVASASLDYLTAPSYKIPISQDGIYQLTYTDTLNAGIDVASVDPRTFKLYNQGGEVAIYVAGEDDGSFDSSDYVLFYGQKMNTEYTDTNIYWLRVSGSTGLRMSEKDGSLTESPVTTPSAFENSLHLEEDHWYVSYLPMQEEADHWYWDFIQATSGPVSKTFNATLHNLVVGSYTPTLRAKLCGGLSNSINPDHHVKIYVNDNLVVDTWWDGQIEHLTEADFPQSYLGEGTNVIKVECPNDTGVGSDVIAINWFEIEYYDTYVAENDSLDFSGDEVGTWEYHVDGFTTSDIEVFDVTNSDNVSFIINAVITPTSSYTLKFEDTITGRAEYLALTTAQRLSPLSIALDTPSDLHSTSNGTDYIIITHSDFYTDVLPLADRRTAQGPRTMVVDVQDVYDEFSYGIFDSEAIRDFLSYAYTNWIAPAPSYVLLVGDGNWDFKDNYGTGEPNYIPPYLAFVEPEQNGERAADNRYACISGDDVLADMYIGRLPAQTSAQASAMVNKILNYEQNPASGDWNGKVLFVADDQPDPKGAGDFWDLSNDIANNYLPNSYAAQKVYYSPGNPPYSTPGDVRTAIINAINEGCLLVNYIGHGAIYWWDHEFLRVNDIASLSNDQELPMMLPMTCYEGYFDYPNLPGLGESIVRAEGKGAIASWSPTGAGLADGHHYLNQGFFTAVFTDNIREIGPATMEGKLNLYDTGDNLDLMDTYLLFGDPFMKLNLPPCDAADLDNDGRITVADIMQVATHWDTKWDDEGFDRKYDLDDDGDIDIVDIMRVAAQWDELC
jgi:hypothetical protein